MPEFKTRVLVIALGITGLAMVIGLIIWLAFFGPMDMASVTVSKPKEVSPSTPVDRFKVASDETLGSGFAVKYPGGWVNTHTGAQKPESKTETQTDENVITSPSGNIQVTLTVQTLAKTSNTCRDGYIKLKYLQADAAALPAYSEGRFAAYVVYFPDFNLYQYHVGMQKNTDAIRGVSLENNHACNFMFSEFIERNSTLPNIPVTTTKLSVNFIDLVSKGQNLKAGLDETEVVEKLSGTEYEQAKAIVQSVYVR